jgi:hypothetical protein
MYPVQQNSRLKSSNVVSSRASASSTNNKNGRSL